MITIVEPFSVTLFLQVFTLFAYSVYDTFNNEDASLNLLECFIVVFTYGIDMAPMAIFIARDYEKALKFYDHAERAAYEDYLAAIEA